MAGVLLCVAHAALLANGLAVGYTLPGPALALLHALRPVWHGLRCRALSLLARALCLPLAGGKVGAPALGALVHEVAADAAWGVLVRALCVGAQLAVFVAAGIRVL